MGVWECLDLFLPFLDLQADSLQHSLYIYTFQVERKGREAGEQSRRKEKARLAKLSFLHTFKFILK